MKKKSIKRRALGWEEWTLLGIVLASTLMIVAALSLQLIDTPTEAAEKSLEKIANDYYITYLYPRLLGRLTNDPKEMLAGYENTGVPTTYLRQLLHFDNNRYAKEATTFSAIGCDTNITGVRYYPVEPYGPRDYTIKYLWKCDTLKTDGFQEKE